MDDGGRNGEHPMGVAQAVIPEESPLVSRPLRPDYTRYRVPPDTGVRLDAYDPDDTGGLTNREQAERATDTLRVQMERLQYRLYAERRRSLLVVLQAMDTGGKDGTIRKVFSGVNPEGCQVWSFKAPSTEELDHHFLWRIDRRTPARGMITVFNRSHYEDVLIARVKQLVPEAVWRGRYRMINDYERTLTQNGTVLLKFYLHISKDEQKRRLQDRLDTPHKRWKFNPDDLEERARWGDYLRAYEDALSFCSTSHAPWYVVPANKKWYRDLVIARIVTDTLTAMDPRFPDAPPGLEAIVIPD